MKHLLLLAIAFLAIAVLASQSLRRKGGEKRVETRPKPLLTPREQAMYWRLRETFPESVVLAQVSFSALITSDRAQRNRYDRKTADFVLCDTSMGVRAVIELDDASHKGRALQDAQRTALLTTAGYSVVRFGNVPAIAELREALGTHTS